MSNKNCIIFLPKNAGSHSELTLSKFRVLMFIEKTISSSTYFNIKLLQVTERLQIILFTILDVYDGGATISSVLCVCCLQKKVKNKKKINEIKKWIILVY